MHIKKKDNLWYALYTVVIVIHLDSKHGCKLYGYNVLERDVDSNKKRPFNRLLTEAMKVAELYQEIEYDLIDISEVQIHLDVNPNTEHGSSCAVKAASGYILGTCGINAKVKPQAWAASYCADRMVRGLIEPDNTRSFVKDFN